MILGLVLSLVALAPQDDIPELTGYSRLRFENAFRELYVLGDNSNGIYSAQRRKRDELLRESSTNFDALFDLDLHLRDWVYDYQRLIELNSSALQLAFEAFYKSLPPDQRSVDHVIEKVRIESQQRLFVIQHPLFGEARILPGIESGQVEDALPLYFSESPDPDFISRLKNSRCLSAEDFETWVGLKAPSDDRSLVIRYLHHLSLGCLQLERDYSLQELREHFLKASEAARAFAEDHQVVLPEEVFTQYLDLTSSLLALHQAIRAQSWSPDWEEVWTWDPEENLKLSPPLFLDASYGHRWPVFSDLASQRGEINRSALQASIDELVEMSGWFSPDEIDYYYSALEQIRLSGWEKLSVNDFHYYKLSKALRALFAARVFPDVPVLYGMALFEGQIINLDAHDQASLINLVFDSGMRLEEHQEFLNELYQESSGELERQQAIQAWIVRKHFDFETADLLSVEEVKEEELVTLLDSETQLPSSESRRSEMTSMLEDVREKNLPSATYGMYPAWLVEPLMVHLFPHPDYLEEEWLKLKDEYSRQGQINRLSREILARDEDDPIRVDLLRRQSDLELWDRDFSSPGMFLGSFSQGMTDSILNNPLHAAKVVGTGALFLVGLKILGGKVVFYLFAGDAGLYVVSGWMQREDADDWYEINTDKAWSLGLASGAFEGTYEAIQLLLQLLTHEDKRKRLDAMHSIGMLTSDIGLFSLGAGATQWAMPWYRSSLLRQHGKLDKQVANYERLISKTRQKITELERELAELQARARAFPDKASDAYLALFDRQTSLQLEISRLRTGQRIHRLGYPRFLLEQAVRLFSWAYLPLRFATDLIFGSNRSKNPIKQIREGFRSFRQNRQLGIAQHERSLAQLDQSLVALEERSFRRVNAPNRWVDPLERRTFNSRVKAIRKSRAKRNENITKGWEHSTAAAEALAELDGLLTAKALRKGTKKAERAFKKALESLEAAYAAAEKEISETLQLQKDYGSGKVATIRERLIHEMEAARLNPRHRAEIVDVLNADFALATDRFFWGELSRLVRAERSLNSIRRSILEIVTAPSTRLQITQQQLDRLDRLAHTQRFVRELETLRERLRPYAHRQGQVNQLIDDSNFSDLLRFLRQRELPAQSP